MTNKHVPLLTAHLFLSDSESMVGLEELILRISECGITVRTYGQNEELKVEKPKDPRVYVSIGEEWNEFTTLVSMAAYEKGRWLHYESTAELQPEHLFYCWLKYTDPMPENKIITTSQFTSEEPLVSIFTASFRSKDKIQRPYQSLLKQTYTNWEWVIVDDSGDDDETYKQFLTNLKDPRVRRYRQDSRNGYIGSTKRYAAGLSTGEILVELDHDDELTPDCLEKIVDAFKKNPECGFAFGDCTEVFVENNQAHWYGWDCGYGYSLYYRVWVHSMNRWQNVLKQTAINSNTIRHLVGLPNHPRAWRRDCYHLIGGHREELLVADDYDLLVRTFLSTKFVAIPNLLYVQYRNEGGENSTFLRNTQIQTLVRELNHFYEERIEARIEELGLPGLLPYSRVWETKEDSSARRTAHINHENSSKVSILFPIPHSSKNKEPKQLLKKLERGLNTNFNEIEIVVVGYIPEIVEEYAAKAPMGAVRWWPMEPTDSLETCIEYAKFCSSCTEKIVVVP
ncbi:glycosyltransferase [Bacillus sp. BGMRC 2118]|nr:glycosyltransferase [Bacillus sp. BGMRC 2118]